MTGLDINFARVKRPFFFVMKRNQYDKNSIYDTHQLHRKLFDAGVKLIISFFTSLWLSQIGFRINLNEFYRQLHVDLS